MTSKPPTPFDQLTAWCSEPRMSTYSHHADPEALYVWNTRLTKAYLEDIQHVEVLLRNRIDTQLSARRGPTWFNDRQYFPFTPHFNKAVSKAKRRAGMNPPPGKIIAELSFDVWRFLLTRRYQSTIWPAVQAGLSNYAVDTSAPRETFENQVVVIYDLRNRCAHHEPVIKHDLEAEERQLDSYDFALTKVAYWIDPDAAQWIAAHSRVNALRADRP